MSKRYELAKGWFRKAESDLTTSKIIIKTEGPYDTVCFHAQQTAEKYLKGLLVLHQEPIPYSHNLNMLSRLCGKHSDSWQPDEMTLATLTEYAVGTRYELSFFPEKVIAEEAICLCEQIKDLVLAAVEALEANES